MNAPFVRNEQPTPRQRFFQTGLFLVLMTMLLEADPPAASVPGGEGDGGPRLTAADAARGAALDASLRAAPRFPAATPLRNVSGLYRGTFSGTGGGRSAARSRGSAVLSLDMVAVEGVDEIFVVRGLLSLSPAATPLKRLLLTSAYGASRRRARARAPPPT